MSLPDRYREVSPTGFTCIVRVTSQRKSPCRACAARGFRRVKGVKRMPAIVLIGGYLAIRVVNRIIERVIEPTLGVTRTQGVKNLFQVVAGVVLVVFVRDIRCQPHGSPDRLPSGRLVHRLAQWCVDTRNAAPIASFATLLAACILDGALRLAACREFANGGVDRPER